MAKSRARAELAKHAYRELPVALDVALFDLAAHPLAHLVVSLILPPVGEPKLSKAREQPLLVEVAAPSPVKFVEYEGRLLLPLAVRPLQELGPCGASRRASHCAAGRSLPRRWRARWWHRVAAAFLLRGFFTARARTQSLEHISNTYSTHSDEPSLICMLPTEAARGSQRERRSAVVAPPTRHHSFFYMESIIIPGLCCVATPGVLQHSHSFLRSNNLL